CGTAQLRDDRHGMHTGRTYEVDPSAGPYLLTPDKYPLSEPRTLQVRSSLSRRAVRRDARPSGRPRPRHRPPPSPTGPAGHRCRMRLLSVAMLPWLSISIRTTQWGGLIEPGSQAST